MADRYASLRQRFEAKVDRSGECWEWTGAFDEPGRRGYGRILLGGHRLLAHRVSYELNVGPIPDEMTIDHLCGNRGCVNPGHLEAVTRGENAARFMRTRTHCKWGHAFAEEGRVNSRGERVCLACHRRRYRERMARKEKDS